MKETNLPVISIEVDGRAFTLDFDIDSVKEFGKHSLARNGRIGDEVLIKYALLKNHRQELITDNMVRKIQGSLSTLTEDDEMSYQDVINYLMRLFINAVDEEAKKVEPAIITIEKDSSVTVVHDGAKYRLTFIREDVKDAVIDGNVSLSYNSPLELYAIGTSVLRLATNHYEKHFSVKFHDNLFLSIWATKFNEETSHMLVETLNALFFHMKDVVLHSGAKNSKPVIKLV